METGGELSLPTPAYAWAAPLLIFILPLALPFAFCVGVGSSSELESESSGPDGTGGGAVCTARPGGGGGALCTSIRRGGGRVAVVPGAGGGGGGAVCTSIRRGGGRAVAAGPDAAAGPGGGRALRTPEPPGGGGGGAAWTSIRRGAPPVTGGGGGGGGANTVISEPLDLALPRGVSAVLRSACPRAAWWGSWSMGERRRTTVGKTGGRDVYHGHLVKSSSLQILRECPAQQITFKEPSPTLPSLGRKPRLPSHSSVNFVQAVPFKHCPSQSAQLSWWQSVVAVV